MLGRNGSCTLAPVMIVWLASYPRSGNTLFRLMFQTVFRRQTYTKYSPTDIARAVNNPADCGPLHGSWSECYGPMSRDPDATYFVKTHEAPEDDGKAIYIVRNGLAAIRSYQHYLLDFNGRDYSLEQIILGEARFRSWGWHLDAWNPLNRPETLLLRYEDLVQSPEEQLERIATFAGLSRRDAWVNEFAKWHTQNPKLFRAGPAVAAEAGYTEEQLQLFWTLHGDWMGKLDYGPPIPAAQHKLRAALSERFHDLDTARAKRTPEYERFRKHWWVKLGKRTGLLQAT